MKYVSSIPQCKQLLEPLALAPYLESFTRKMQLEGFTTLTINSYSGAVCHFGTWLDINTISPCCITTKVIQLFSTHRCACSGKLRKNCLSRKYVRRVSRFVTYLHEIKVVDEKPGSKNQTPHLWDQAGFCNWLSCDRGLATITVENYLRALSQILPDLGYDIQHYTAEQIRRVVCKYTNRHSPANSKRLTTALRAYLKYLVLTGLCQHSLIAAVPTVAQWRLSTLPRYISVDEITKIIQSCDISTPMGLRDHAILLLLARLGLRASDVVNLLMSDIDWTRATILLRGKTRRTSRLPLPQDAGDAILRYLESGRVRDTACNQLFLCTTAPYRPLSTPSIVSGIVRAAIVRSGINTPPFSGAHLLRHSAATGWLREGVGLDTVSTILRHSSNDMTMHYAKIDVNALSELAVAWPGSAS